MLHSANTFLCKDDTNTTKKQQQQQQTPPPPVIHIHIKASLKKPNHTNLKCKGT